MWRDLGYAFGGIAAEICARRSSRDAGDGLGAAAAATSIWSVLLLGLLAVTLPSSARTLRDTSGEDIVLQLSQTGNTWLDDSRCAGSVIEGNVGSYRSL